VTEECQTVLPAIYVSSRIGLEMSTNPFSVGSWRSGPHFEDFGNPDIILDEDEAPKESNHSNSSGQGKPPRLESILRS
jgi:hypothetical protein